MEAYHQSSPSTLHSPISSPQVHTSNPDHSKTISFWSRWRRQLLQRNVLLINGVWATFFWKDHRVWGQGHSGLGLKHHNCLLFDPIYHFLHLIYKNYSCSKVDFKRLNINFRPFSPHDIPKSSKTSDFNCDFTGYLPLNCPILLF